MASANVFPASFALTLTVLVVKLGMVLAAAEGSVIAGGSSTEGSTCPVGEVLYSNRTAMFFVNSGLSHPTVFSIGDFDSDRDGDVDLTDFLAFQACHTASGPDVRSPLRCRKFDSDSDADVDMHDAQAFQRAFSPPPPHSNDSCHWPTAVAGGSRSFSTNQATTDGPDEPALCNFFGRSQVQSDIWFCYTASCTGEVLVSLCGSDYDTKMAVYSGCGCPVAPGTAIACSDDDCGTGIENIQSRVTFQATSGQQYMIRVGGFLGERGEGLLTVQCDFDGCEGSTNECFVESPNSSPGCSDSTCCSTTCGVDQYCCDVRWDDFCAGEAEGLCDGQFAACAVDRGSCGSPHTQAGCSNVECCNTVCAKDPFCCLTEWDANCVDEANSTCFLTCTARAADCFTAHPTAGCNSRDCCALVCPDDPFCCETEWDDSCVTSANQVCPR